MARRKREAPVLPPGPARDLVDLFRRLRDSSQLSIGQIASRTGYAPSHVSEVLRGWKAPSPDAAAKIARALGADDNTVRRARRRADDLREWKRDNSRNRPRPRAPHDAPDYPGLRSLEAELGRAIVHYATVDGRRDVAGRAGGRGLLWGLGRGLRVSTGPGPGDSGDGVPNSSRRWSRYLPLASSSLVFSSRIMYCSAALFTPTATMVRPWLFFSWHSGDMQ
jgi:transcriptional regulator with XRE-family HTH domain